MQGLKFISFADAVKIYEQNAPYLGFGWCNTHNRLRDLIANYICTLTGDSFEETLSKMQLVKENKVITN
jgi:hypothetical protein